MTDLPTKEEMAGLDALITQWDTNEQHIEYLTDALKLANVTKLKLETDLIPSLMASAGGIDTFTLDNGTAITIKDELYASITQAKQQEAFAWLNEHGHADIIKDNFTVALGRGKLAEERASQMLTLFESLGIDDYSRKRAVHPGTLQALLKEQLAEGVEVPKETFGVYQQRRAVIKLAKGAR